ncbi:MAG: hypothetical protein HWN66_06345 [Candidatus Helarchaeota archaeon]|nr:hypothetical protein [Candidatus Helarchaeota archaeon]
MSKDIWELYEFWKALEGDLKELGKSDVVSQKLLAQFTKYLKDPREFIRGKVLGMLGERLRETKFKDKVLLNPLIECWDDEKYWIREVASDLIRQWGSQYFKPKEIFEELSKYILSNLDTLEIDDPATGNAPGDHAIRILFYIYIENKSLRKMYEEYGINIMDDFTKFLQRLKSKYAKYKIGTKESSKTCLENVHKIVRYFSSFIELEEGPWDEVVVKFSNQLQNSRTCWTCAHWRSQQVPLEYLQKYLQSKDYARFYNVIRDSWEAMFEGEDINPFDDITGRFRPELESFYCLRLMGYCIKFNKITKASDESNQYEQRKVKLPFAHVFLTLNKAHSEHPPFLLWMQMDEFMQNILQDWLIGVYHHGPDD